jgi:lipoate---protein ligase
MDPSYRVLFLWRNSETVVIGRHQNPWKECHLDKMENDGIFLARRQSGGGAVFHDLGNTNFTFMTSREQYSQEENFQIIIDALGAFGIPAERSGRNDLLVEGRKISGSAFKHARDRSFHHGTLLIDADLLRLVDYLSPTKRKLLSKGIDSVRSRVANLREYVPDLTHDALARKIFEVFCSHYGESAEVEHLDSTELAAEPSLNAYYDQMKDWEWRFGRTPDFSHHLETRFDWGEIDLHLDVRRGRIVEVRVFSDALNTEIIDYLNNTLGGTRYDRKSVTQVLETGADRVPGAEEHFKELTEWMAKEL